MREVPASPGAGRRATHVPHVLIALLLAGIISVLLFLAFVGMDLLASVRAYVTGEGHWSKAQKEAVYFLICYANTHRESDFALYQDAISIPLADREARLELEKPYGDLAKARAALIRGRNDPADVVGMAALYRTFRRVSYMDRAVTVWAKGDDLIQQLNVQADRLHAEVASGHPDHQRLRQIFLEIDRTHRQIPPLANEFSRALSEAARWGQWWVVRIMLGCALVLFLAAMAITRRLLRNAREADARYHQLVGSANDAIFVSDLQTGVILEANQKAEQLTGIPLAELLGRRQETLFTSQGGAATIVRADGAELPVEISANTLSWGRREVVQSILHDVSVRQRLEAELRQAAKMEAIGRLAGGVAHDFNNLLTIISGYGEMARDSTPPAARENLDRILEAANRATRLTQQLLAFGRRQMLRPRRLDLVATVGSLQAMLRRLIREDIELVFELDTEPGMVMADPTQIEQVLLNLAANARDAMPNGGWLRVHVSNTEVQDGGEHPKFVPAGAYVLISITDTGQGMAPETVSHIFEPFYTTKEVGKGTGLGLATVYGIVKQSGGYIDVTSAVGEGSTFRLYFPRVGEVPEQPVQADVSRPAVRGKGTILLAEDQPEVRALIRMALEQHGYRVLEAVDGTRARQLFERERGQIDLLITDLIMPEMGGRELGDEVRRQAPRVPVLYISGYGGDVEEAHPVLPDRAALLTKPFSPAQLVQKVQELLNHTGVPPCQS